MLFSAGIARSDFGGESCAGPAVTYRCRTAGQCVSPDAGPFQLDVDFVVYVQVPATGRLNSAMESRRYLVA